MSWSSWRCSWPKPFTIRTPVTDSSTTVATSPASCCASQLAGKTAVRSRSAVQSSAGVTSSITSVSSGESDDHDHERDQEHQDVADHDRQELQQALDQHDVGAGAAHELTGLHLVVAREVEPLELAEDRGAEVVLHRERDAAAAEPADEREAEARDAEDDEQQQPRPERAARVGDDVVDDDLLHQRRERGDRRPDDRHAERGDRVALVRRGSSRSAAGSNPACWVARLGLGSSCSLAASARLLAPGSAPERVRRSGRGSSTKPARSVDRVDERLEPLGHRGLGRRRGPGCPAVVRRSRIARRSPSTGSRAR